MKPMYRKLLIAALVVVGIVIAILVWPKGEAAVDEPNSTDVAMYTPEGSDESTATAEPTPTSPLPSTPGTATEEEGTTDSTNEWWCPSYATLAAIWAPDALGVWAKPIDATTYELTGLYFVGGQLAKVALRPDQAQGVALTDSGWSFIETVETPMGSYQWWSPPAGIENCVFPQS